GTGSDTSSAFQIVGECNGGEVNSIRRSAHWPARARFRFDRPESWAHFALAICRKSGGHYVHLYALSTARLLRSLVQQFWTVAKTLPEPDGPGPGSAHRRHRSGARPARRFGQLCAHLEGR